MNVAH